MANTEVEAVDFDREDDDLMDEDGGVVEEAAPMSKLKSTINGGASEPKRTKGRGFRQESDAADRNTRLAGRFDSFDSDGGPGPKRCIRNYLQCIQELMKASD